MDLLPHLEMIQIQKTTYFGQVYSKLIRIDDLEKVDYEELSEKGKHGIIFVEYYQKITSGELIKLTLTKTLFSEINPQVNTSASINKDTGTRKESLMNY